MREVASATASPTSTSHASAASSPCRSRARLLGEAEGAASASPPLPDLTRLRPFACATSGERRSPEQRRYQQAAAERQVGGVAESSSPRRSPTPTSSWRSTERRLRRAKVQEGVVSGRRYGLLDLSVSPDSLDRGLRIFDALLKALAAADFTVSLVPPPAERRRPGARPTSASAHAGALPRGAAVRVPLRGGRRRARPEALSPATQARGSHLVHAARAAALHLQPDRLLALQITNLAGTGVRGLFRETERRRLEDILPRFVAQLAPAAEALRAKHAEEERRRRELEEQARRWREEEERRWEESAGSSASARRRPAGERPAGCAPTPRPRSRS